MKIRYFTNIPSPYRINFFNELGKYCDLEVIFEAEKAPKINSNWYKGNYIYNFDSFFLKKGVIKEKKINIKIFKYVLKSTDILVFTNYSYLTEMFALVLAKILKKKYVLQIDGGIISYNESFMKRKLKKFLISNALSYLSPSQATDEFLIYYGAKKDIIGRYPFTSLYRKDIIVNPITSIEKKLLREKKEIKESKVILSVGRFIPIKGFDWMIEAYKDLDKDIGVYIIGGGGKSAEEYITMKNTYQMDNLHFIDFQDKKSILEWYKLADLFVLPTRGDVWGLVINEALSQGLPVITTNKCIAGLELIKNYVNGYIINVEDKKNLLNITNEFFKKDIYIINQMKASCLQIIENYTIENMAKIQYRYLKNISGEK